MDLSTVGVVIAAWCTVATLVAVVTGTMISTKRGATMHVRPGDYPRRGIAWPAGASTRAMPGDHRHSVGATF